MNSPKGDHKHDQKRNGPTSIMIIGACLLGAALGLFGLNIYHATECQPAKSKEELESYIEAINRRLLQAESEVISIILLKRE